ncbi:ADP-ribosylation factor [Mycena alexandri]|uniref:ADP-ribosylation factor n=1 Tax=Mycena alexandri TaxID=1745969 RepID=A0AAD6SDU7_9AGAR|nr:ADP-ribosylation factor [Mycena alexandri]
MTSVMMRLLERFYSPGVGYSAMFLGLDASGKTTLLYRMKLGEVVRTIPSIGLNVETVRLKARGRSDRVLNLTCWDAGACGRGYLTNYLVMYASYCDAIVWLIDSSDRERLEDSIREFTLVLERLAEDKTIPPKERPILILATKQDAPNALTLDEIRIKVAPAIRGRNVFSAGMSLTQSLTEGPIPDAFASKTKPTPLEVPKPVIGRKLSNVEERLPEWLARAENDSPAADFLQQFEAITLPAWDHYTHIRIAYLLLTQFGRQKGKDRIFRGIEKYIASSAQTSGRTFHVTMTYFWIQIVHFGIRSTPPLTHSDADSDLGARISEPEESIEHDDFPRFLLLNPFVAEGNLWADYYSKGVMMSVEAKGGMVLPDIKPLPNLVVRDAISAS